MNKPYKVKITFLRKCPFYEEGEEVILNNDEFFRMMNDKICTEAWDRISEYVHAALKSGLTTENWIEDKEIMITCCRTSAEPMSYRLERIDE